MRPYWRNSTIKQRILNYVVNLIVIECTINLNLSKDIWLYLDLIYLKIKQISAFLQLKAKSYIMKLMGLNEN